MKFTLLVALTAAVKIDEAGIPMGSLHTGNHWRERWPRGVDDSTNDHLVLGLATEPKEPAPPIKYWDKMRQWEPHTWPTYFTWNAGWDHATYHHQIDDGTDDNEVVDVMHKAEGI